MYWSLYLRLDQANRLVNASALSATSRHPLSIVRACPRLGISTISVTEGFRSYCLNEAFAMAHGTVLSFCPEMINSGPRTGFSVSTFASFHGLRFAVAACNNGAPNAAAPRMSYRVREPPLR